MTRALGLFVPFLLVAGFSLPAVSGERNCYFDCHEVPPADRVLYQVGKPTRKALAPGEVRMIAWNVYKGGKPEFLRVFSELRQIYRPDIIALEEGALDDLVLPALNSVPGFGWNMSANFLLKGGIPTGPMIGTAVTPASVTYERTTDVEPFVLSPKTAVIEEFPIEGSAQKLLVIAIHGINFTADAAFERQLTELYQVIDRHQGPVVFAGDFNIRNYERAEFANRIAGEHGLTRAPWEGPSESIYYQLDDAFTRGVEMLASEVLSEDVKDVGSDHPALYLKFKLSK